MKLKLISILILFLLMLSFTTSAVQVSPGVEYVSGDIIYGFAWQMNFSVISVNNSWMLFNSTNFTIEPIHRFFWGESVTRGAIAGGTDTLAHNGDDIDIINVSQTGVGYTSGGIDYIATDNTIDWSPAGAEPAPGSTYRVWYWVNSSMNITMQYMHENYSNATYGDSCLQFNSQFNSTGCKVYFNITGFDDHANYSLYNDSIHVLNIYTGTGTTISFNVTDWSDHDFDIRKGQVNASNVTFIRVQAKENIPNMISLADQVTTILGVALIISAILIIIGFMYSAQKGGEE